MMAPELALAYANVLKAPVEKAVPFEQRWSVWGTAFGGYNHTDGDPLGLGTHDLAARAGGVAAGLDYRPSRETIVGLAGGRRRHRLQPCERARPWQQRCVPGRRLWHDALRLGLRRRSPCVYGALDVDRPLCVCGRSSDRAL